MDNSKPLEYVKSFDSKKHMILLYEEPEYAFMINSQFIKKGLEKGEHCIYTTEEDPQFIENQMRGNGIDVDDFKKKNLLHIYQIFNSEKKEVLERARENLKMILANSKPPYRIVARLFTNMSTEEEISANLQFEQEIHSSFKSFDGSLICPYPMENIVGYKRRKWFVEIMKRHNVVIFAPKSSEGRAFETG